MKKVLKKVLEELSKEKPDLSYIRGMLEVLSGEDEEVPMPDFVKSLPYLRPTLPVEPEVDEGAILDAKARAAIETVKRMTNTDE